MEGANDMSTIKTVSLFCGCGGMDIGLVGGFEYIGNHYKTNPYDIVHASDFDKYPIDIYNNNFKHKAEVLDITKTSPTDYPDHDLLIGGFPCQSFSIVAQNPPRLGYKDNKGKLFFKMCDILKEKQPRAFIAENVKGILSANNGKALPLVLEGFKESGYYVDYKLINSADFGVPQKRERVFIVGFKNLNDYENFKFPKQSVEQYTPLKEVLEPAENIDQKYYFSNKAVAGMEKVRAKMNKGRVQNPDLPSNTVTSHLAKSSLNSTDPVLYSNGKYRRYTPTEVKRIQSFPDSFQLVGSETRVYQSLGNAVPPVVMWHISRALNDALTYRKDEITSNNDIEVLEV